MTPEEFGGGSGVILIRGVSTFVQNRPQQGRFQHIDIPKWSEEDFLFRNIWTEVFGHVFGVQHPSDLADGIFTQHQQMESSQESLCCLNSNRGNK